MKDEWIPAEEIFYTEVDGQNLRCLKIENKNTDRIVLLLNGHHSNLERFYSVCKFYSRFANVYSYDYPGFGKSPRFKRKHATMNRFAELNKNFMAQMFPGKKITIACISLGFVFVTEMLQKFPESRAQVEKVVAVAGFVRAAELKMSRLNRFFLQCVAMFSYFQWVVNMVDYVLFQTDLFLPKLVKSQLIKKQYGKFSAEEQRKAYELEMRLWRENDSYTHFFTTLEFLSFDFIDYRIPDVPVIFVHPEKDRYLDFDVVNADVKKVYAKADFYKMIYDEHAPAYVESEESIAGMFPKELHSLL